jgi:MFS family permease
MARARDFWSGPWRAVPVLGVTQILAWGTIFYSPVLTAPLIAAERGWSLTFTMGGFSIGLLVGGLVSPFVGRSIDHYGGHVVMPIGSLTGALGLAGLAFAETPVIYLLVWMLLGAGLAASLYDPAFATLGRIFGAAARRPITVLTLAGGFASTIGWPSTHFLIGHVGWRGTYLVYAALLAGIAAPLHAFALPRQRAGAAVTPHDAAAAMTRVLPSNGIAFLLVAVAFASYAFVPSALSAHLLAMFGRFGLEPGTAVAIGTLFGPAQVAARLCELAFGRNVHPLSVARFAVGLLVFAFVLLALATFSVPLALTFALLFGIANGLITITRGAVPLALFGPVGYGRLVGRIAGPSLIMQALAPVAFAFVAERSSDATALAFTAVFAVVALGCFLTIRRPP